MIRGDSYMSRVQQKKMQTQKHTSNARTHARTRARARTHTHTHTHTLFSQETDKNDLRDVPRGEEPMPSVGNG